MGEIYRNQVSVTSVFNERGKQFAFGVTLEPQPRSVFFPHWVIRAFEITTADQGYILDCLYVDQPADKSPTVIAVLGEDVKLEKSQIAGSYTGRPGTADFEAIVNLINRKQS